MPAMRSNRGSGPILAGQRSPINPPTLIEYNHLRFLIADAPSNNNLSLYMQVKTKNIVIINLFSLPLMLEHFLGI